MKRTNTGPIGIRYSTGIIKYPSGRFGLVGSVPSCFANKTYNTESEVVDDLLSLGITKFQLSNCSWYDEEGKDLYEIIAEDNKRYLVVYSKDGRMRERIFTDFDEGSEFSKTVNGSIAKLKEVA